jgi:hypothetical protein
MAALKDMTLQQVIDKFKENDCFDKDLEAEFRKNDCDGKKLVSWEGHLVEHFLRAAVENIARVMIAMKCMCIDSCICYDMCVCVLTLLSRCSSRHASSSSIHRPQTRRECCHGCRRAPIPPGASAPTPPPAAPELPAVASSSAAQPNEKKKKKKVTFPAHRATGGMPVRKELATKLVNDERRRVCVHNDDSGLGGIYH